jgi:hypothetical protein
MKIELSKTLLQQIQALLEKFPDVQHFELERITDKYSNYYQLEFCTQVQNTYCTLITVLDTEDESTAE